MSYPSDLNDAEWKIIKRLLPPEKTVGSPREVDLREVLNATFYRADNGIKWRAMPVNFPAWQTVYGYFRLWVRLGVWEQINTALVEQVRVAAGRNPEPSLVVTDSQSVKSAQKRGDEQGVDGHKKVKGRKRHLTVDVLGLVLGCCVTAANVADIKAAQPVWVWVLEQYGRIAKILADQSYRSGTVAQQLQTADRCTWAISQRVAVGKARGKMAMDCRTDVCLARQCQGTLPRLRRIT